jgi:CxxC-x17-CxxC domain-containing protein
MYQDETLKCKDCGEEFVFTAQEQELFAERGYANKPVRCPSCRSARRSERGDRRPPREMYDAVCYECGAETKVPFMPKEDRPVYCSSCFEKRR